MRASCFHSVSSSNLIIALISSVVSVYGLYSIKSMLMNVIIHLLRSMCDHACVLCLYIRACSRCESVFMPVSEIMHCVFMCCIPLLALCVCV